MTTDIFQFYSLTLHGFRYFIFKFIFFIKIMNKRAFFQQGIVHCLYTRIRPTISKQTKTGLLLFKPTDSWLSLH